MDWNQMQERCPSSRFVSVAVLPNHKLAFSRKSEKRECGVADALPEQGVDVWGVVYEIDDRDIGLLDYHEGYQSGRKTNAYRREERQAFRNGDMDTPLAVAVYFAIPQDNPPLPNQKYKDQILSGANYWHLPSKYIHKVIEPIKVKL